MQVKLFVTMGAEWPQIPPELAGHTGYLLSRAGLAVRGLFARELSALGISPRDFGVLQVIDGQAPITQQALGAALGIDPSTTVGIVDALERQELVERRRHPTDRRANALHLTRAGKRTLMRARAVVRSTDAAVFGRLSDDERATLHDLLGRVLEEPPSDGG
jgi:DNA-binding MarR family transcriptional regulator